MGEARVCVGAIAGAFGVKGEVRLKSFCADPAAIFDYAPLSTEDGGRNFTLRLTRPIEGGFAARVSGIATKEQGDALKGTRLYVDRDRLPALPDEEFYHADLIGLAVLDTGGASLGTVRAVHDHGAGDLIEVAGAGLKAPVLIPFTHAVVPTVDLTAGRLIVDLPPGLLPGTGSGDD